MDRRRRNNVQLLKGTARTMTGHVSASRIIDASADEVFRIVTDTARLPEWNRAITAVIDRPDRITVGDQWIVEMRALGQRWHSRSEVEVLDPTGRCFAYRSATDDANPSYALWTWVVADHPAGALVTIACELHPATFWRRALLVRIRSRQLAHTELMESLVALEAMAQRSTGALPCTDTRGAR
jgi:uncharacterized protein YndB with AHSA1/START domain